MNFETAIGLLAAVLITVANLPQAYKTIRARSVSGLSPITYSLLSLGCVAWVMYGISKEDWPIILSNGISLLLALIILYQILSSKKS